MSAHLGASATVSYAEVLTAPSASAPNAPPLFVLSSMSLSHLQGRDGGGHRRCSCELLSPCLRLRTLAPNHRKTAVTWKTTKKKKETPELLRLPAAGRLTRSGLRAYLPPLLERESPQSR